MQAEEKAGELEALPQRARLRVLVSLVFTSVGLQLINAALVEHVKGSDEPLEDTLRRVLREELRGASG